jgi:PTH2 family peptidyl-tRNA hydrolase
MAKNTIMQTSEEVKQVIIVRSDIKMSRGKLVAQTAHASLESYEVAKKTNEKVVKEWIESGQKKIVVKVGSEDALVKLFKAFEFKKVPCALISDAGLTQLPPGTKTALGVGPWYSKELNPLTGGLKLL